MPFQLGALVRGSNGVVTGTIVKKVNGELVWILLDENFFNPAPTLSLVRASDFVRWSGARKKGFGLWRDENQRNLSVQGGLHTAIEYMQSEGADLSLVKQLAPAAYKMLDLYDAVNDIDVTMSDAGSNKRDRDVEDPNGGGGSTAN